MKKAILGVLVCMMLTGCGSVQPSMDRAAALRSRFLSEGCAFDAAVTADYGEAIWTFSLQCQADAKGDLTFTVTAPEEIAGITGRVSQQGAGLTFDDQLLGFPLLADGQLSPVGAPWMMVQSLRSGCFRTCARAGEGLELMLDDRYEDKALTLTVRTDGQDLPINAEFLWEGRRILSMELENFRFL